MQRFQGPGSIIDVAGRSFPALRNHARYRETDRKRQLIARHSRESMPSAAAIVEHLRQVFEQASIGPPRLKRGLGEVLSRYA